MTTFGHTFPGVLSGARAGSDWAWRAIYRDLAPPVLGYLRACGAIEPEDVLGEVFLQVVRDLPGFSGDERDFRAWIFTIAHHRILDEARRRGRRPSDPAPAETLARLGPVRDAERDALESLDAARVRALIGELAGDQRTVLLLRVLGDLTVEEVARLLGKRAGAVKALQRRALAAIRERIEAGA